MAAARQLQQQSRPSLVSPHTRCECWGKVEATLVRRTATGKETCISAMSLLYLLCCVNRTACISRDWAKNIEGHSKQKAKWICELWSANLKVSLKRESFHGKRKGWRLCVSWQTLVIVCSESYRLCYETLKDRWIFNWRIYTLLEQVCLDACCRRLVEFNT